MEQATNHSLDEALSTLDHAASESSDELKKLLKNDYRRLRRVVVDIAPELKGPVQEFKEKSAETLVHARDNVVRFSTDTAQKVDRSAHESPWWFVGGAALTTAALGFWLGRKSSS